MQALTLDISTPEDGGGWQAAWFLDGNAVGIPISIDRAAADQIHREGSAFLDYFEHHGHIPGDPQRLRAMGRMLFERWFAPAWPAITPQLRDHHRELLIRAADGKALNLPWELVELTGDIPVGCDPAWSIRRTPLAGLQPGPPLEAGPLRILFLTAAPIDQARLDYEREEEAMLRATGQLREEVVVLFAETGTFDELAELVAQHRPHVVHLSGHGKLDGNGIGTFAFEDERGKTDSREASEIVQRIFRGTGVRCVFLNACQTAQAAATGLCQAMVTAGVPLAIGWAASVADNLATEFAKAFYRRLIRGEPAPAAAAHARAEIRDQGNFHEGQVELQNPTFALPQLYCSVQSGEVFDRAASRQKYEGPRTEYALLEDGIKGLREGFIGRRRQIQRLLPPLRDGDITFAVLTGIGGAGKSTLATRAANMLETAGFKVLGVRSADGDAPAACGRATLSKIRDAIGRAFITAKRQDLYDILTNGKIAEDHRLRLAIDGLKELRIALVLDNFENVLNFKTREIVDPALAQFYTDLALNLTTGSRVIVTCRYLPGETPDPEAQLNIAHVPLGDFDERDFFKFMHRDDAVAERIRTGKLPQDLLKTLYGKVGGTPRFLGHIRKVLGTIDPNELADELKHGNPGAMEVERQKYYETIFVERLYKSLSAAARLTISHLAVSELPLPVDAIASIIGEADEQLALESLNAGVAIGLLQEFSEGGLPKLYHPPGLLRPWLREPSRLTEAKTLHTHGLLAAFWRKSYKADREVELRVPVTVELMACRSHAQLGGDASNLNWATIRLALMLEKAVEWRQARELLEDIQEADRDGECWLTLARIETFLGDWGLARQHFELALPLSADGSPMKSSIWHNLATIDMNEGDYPAAREKFAKAMDIRRAIGDRAGEAGTWHQLATIDLKEGDHPAAREKFAKAMDIIRAIGDRAGEAATWYQLGVLATRMGRGDLGAALIAICWLIDKAIGHGDSESDLKSLLGFCAEMQYTQEQILAVISNATTEYRNDRGRGLLERAFAADGDSHGAATS